MKRIASGILMLAGLLSADASAERMFDAQRERWLSIAEAAKPELQHTSVRPAAVVKAVEDSSAFQNWRYDSVGSPADLLYGKNMKEVKEITLDFGKHLTGYLTINTATLSRCQDAPVRLKLFFGELPAELNTPLDPWPGSLSRAWMQDEVVTITDVDSPVRIPRRLAGRYLRIELLGASPDFDFGINDVTFDAVSSASGSGQALAEDCPPSVRRIHDVGLETLRECMQTVYEDGPKRDHRLWAGDMYLQSLANKYSFRNFDLTKRCLYLFAALAADNGVVISNIFEEPEPHAQFGSFCLSYSLLWNSTLLEYLKDTDDLDTALDLWEVARRQMEYALAYVNDRNLYDRTKGDPWTWLFFDWREGLDMNAPMQGAMIFALDQTYDLARRLGKEEEVAHWPEISAEMKKAAREHLYDSERGVFLSGANRQLSVLGQTWLIKAGVLSREEAQRALRVALDSPESLKPGTPYGTHYLIDALLEAGMEDEARSYLEQYWGGMVEKGADTFWESYDPDDDFISAYGFSPVNSACHAWSCTPVYFIHKYPEVMQSPSIGH